MILASLLRWLGHMSSSAVTADVGFQSRSNCAIDTGLQLSVAIVLRYFSCVLHDGILAQQRVNGNKGNIDPRHRGTTTLR